MTFDHATLPLLAEALTALEREFQSLPALSPELDASALRGVLTEVAERLGDNLPYHHPLYMGQMLKPPHPIARLAYGLAQFLNPNNHALDGGRASSAMEKEAVTALARMFGWSQSLGHLTGGGTMANFEALWVSRELNPGRAIAASAQAHYTHARLAKVLGVPFISVPTNAWGQMEVAALEEHLHKGESDLGTVVATLGTTAAGAVDPLPELLRLQERYRFRIHVDAAYGGYFGLCANLSAPTQAAFSAVREVDSIVIDPHKHGLQPYGCGCILFRDPSVGRFYHHDSPYTYFTSDELHLGEISLECSRAGAAAVALWATQRLLPLERGGKFATDLSACRTAALAWHRSLFAEPSCVPLFPPELDIVVWAMRASSAEESSRAARAVFAAAAEQNLHLALARFPRHMVEPCGAVAAWDSDSVECLRACVMKPEHLDWLPDITQRLRKALAECANRGLPATLT